MARKMLSEALLPTRANLSLESLSTKTMKSPHQLGTVVILPFASISGKERVTRKRGRPRKVERRPAVDQDAYNAAVCEARDKAVASDPLVIALNSGRSGAEVLRATKVALAEETAALAALRRQHEGEGKDISQLASRRVDGLSKLANLILELHKIGGNALDPRGARMQVLFGFFVDSVAEAARATLPAAKADEVIQRLKEEAAGWEDRIDASR